MTTRSTERSEIVIVRARPKEPRGYVSRSITERARVAERERDDLRRSLPGLLEQARQEGREALLAEQAAERQRRVTAADVREAFVTAAAGRLTAVQLDELLEDLLVERYVLDDGRVDLDRVARKLDGLRPGPNTSRHGPSGLPATAEIPQLDEIAEDVTS